MPISSFPYPSQSQCFFFPVKPVAKSRMRKSRLPGPSVPGRPNFVRWLQIFSQHNYGMFPLHFNRTLYTHGAEGQIGMNFRGYYRTASPRCKTRFTSLFWRVVFDDGLWILENLWIPVV